MKWFDRWFAKKVKWAWDNNNKPSRDRDMEYPTNSPVNAVGNSPRSSSNIRFTIYPASGGYVVEHQVYSPHKDRDSALTIVNHGEELGKVIEHIITLEALRT